VLIEKRKKAKFFDVEKALSLLGREKGPQTCRCQGKNSLKELRAEESAPRWCALRKRTTGQQQGEGNLTGKGDKVPNRGKAEKN